ncbi:hypothetical protein GCM10023115_27020 [Pontixanthobacter gangjinensis]|uniref:Uncharacterized protein n=1 Tax=Christiangramia aestuarii TaxID=1028746 RepID=A0A7K1LM82_9FLAO|nr:hypothetical protein [Christiangramia aestuarii]MUP41934.1 hypothetical protein [Christiangramia aestuarii]
MRTITKFFTYCAIGTSVLLTSCVSEDISPQVEELRSAQADYLRAQAAFETAQAETQAAQAALLQAQAEIAKAESEAKIAMMTAETALMEAQAAYEEALMEARTASEIAKLEAAVAEAQYQKELLEAELAAEKARLQTEIAQAELAAAQARLATQQAVDALAAQINETAQGYLDLYETNTMRAGNKLDQINNLKTIVSRYEANLDAEGNVLNFGEVEAELQAQIDADLAEIEAIEANISRLQGLNANAEDVREELTQVENRIDELEAALNEGNLAMERIYNIYETFASRASEVGDRISYIENDKELIGLYQTEISKLEENLAEASERIEPYTQDISDIESSLEDEYATLINLTQVAEEEWYDLKYAEFNGTTDDLAQAQEAYDAAKQNIIEYAGDYYGGPVSEWSYNSDTNTWEFEGYTYNARIWMYDNPIPGTPYGDAVSTLNNFNSNENYRGLLNRISRLTSTLASYNNAVINLNDNINYNQERLEAIFSNLGVSNAEEFWATLNELTSEYYEAWYAVSEIESELGSQWDLRWDLYYYLNDPNRSVADFENQIAAYQDQIAALEAEIEQNQELLVQNAFEASEMEAMIQRTEDRIARLMEEYEALKDLADQYLEMFYEIVDNN